MQTNFIKNLLNLEDVIVKNIKNLKEKAEIYIELPVKEHLCPYCGAETTKIHDYRTQIITDIPVYFKNTKLIYNKRRYECKLCHKSFYENNSIVNKYSRKSTRLTEFVVDQLRKLSSCSDIANMCGISPGYISRLFPYLAVTEKLKLLQTIFILLDMFVMLLIKLEFLYKIIYQEKKEYTLNTLENFFFQENVI